MSLLLAISIKITTILVMALVALPLLRRESAATRHWILATAIAGALLVPALGLVVPSWSMPSIRVAEPEVESRAEFTAPARLLRTVVRSESVDKIGPRASDTRVAVLVMGIWIAGTSFALGALALALVRLTAIATAARPVDDGRCHEIAREIADGYGVRRRVRLLCGDHPALLVTWGLAKPIIILPDAARTWSDDRLRAVLSHELAHVRRGDWATQLAAELLRALQWFNPVAWIVCRRLRRESEHACDDAVLNAGVAGPAYATHLIDLARAYSIARSAWSPALPVARPSGLERRVRAMLDAHLNRRPVTRATRLVAALLFLTLAGAVAGAALFAQGPFATVAGSISDSMRGALPDATLTITNSSTKAKNEVRSDSSGRFEFVGLPPGDYVLEASVVGFKNHRTTLTLNGQQVDREIVIDVATLQEAITVTDAPPRPRSADDQAALDRRNALQAKRALEMSTTCREAAAAGSGPAPIRGRIRPPMKLVDVRPEYPAALREAKVGGDVELEARIGVDGSVVEVRGADPSAHPDLVSAAIDAVRQWRFDETLLNCVPIEVLMNVSVTFRPRQ